MSAWEFKLGSSQRLDTLSLVLIFGSYAHYWLANVNASYCAQRLAESASHARLKTIGAGTRQHLVYTYDVERVNAHANVKRVLAAVFN